MYRFVMLAIDTLPVLVVLAPGILFLSRRGMIWGNGIRKFWMIIFAVYLAGIFEAIGMPNILYLRFDPVFNLIPLADCFGDPIAYLGNTVLNIVLFAPLGFFLPMLWKYFRSLKRTAFCGLTLSLLVELLQIFTFRLTDGDDLLTNTMGTVLGYGAASWLLPLLEKYVPGVSGGSRRELAAVGILVFLTMFFVQPLLVWILYN